MNIKPILTFFAHLPAEVRDQLKALFTSSQKAWNELTPAQQQAIIGGSQIAQLLKTQYRLAEGQFVALAASNTSLPVTVVTASILAIGKDLGVDTGRVQDVLDHVADTVQKGITDNHYNALFSSIAKFGADYLSTGTLNWTSLALGVVEFCYNAYVKK